VLFTPYTGCAVYANGSLIDGQENSEVPEVPDVTPADPTPRWTDSEKPQPTRVRLNRLLIVEAALSLVEEQGLDALTIRKLSAQLSVSPMALYKHVTDKTELTNIMLDHLISQVPFPDLTAKDWRAELQMVALEYHLMWQKHPGFAAIYSPGVTLGPNGLKIVDAVLGVFLNAGFAPQDTADGMAGMWRTIIGWHQVGPVRPIRLPEGQENNRTMALYGAADPADIPHILSLTKELERPSFRFLLDRYLDGLVVHLKADKTSRRKVAVAPAKPGRKP
jgi:AcrR family transcriptional regulator